MDLMKNHRAGSRPSLIACRFSVGASRTQIGPSGSLSLLSSTRSVACELREGMAAVP